jgi:hypothetical protein
MVVSHPFARKKAKGWGTELVQNQTVKDLVAPFGYGGFPPFRQKKGERMGHGIGTKSNGQRPGRDLWLWWFPTLSPEKRRKDGARKWYKIKRSKT